MCYIAINSNLFGKVALYNMPIEKPAAPDKRYQRTHAKIRQVFEQLILTHTYSEITVSMIARQTGVNRKTFYMHYESVSALMDELVRDIVEEIRTQCAADGQTIGMGGAGVPAGFFRALARREELHMRLIGTPEYLFAFHRIADALAGESQPPADADPQQAFRRRALTTFLTSGVMPIYRDWLLSGKPIPEEELAHLVEQMMQGCLQSLARNKERSASL